VGDGWGGCIFISYLLVYFLLLEGVKREDLVVPLSSHADVSLALIKKRPDAQLLKPRAGKGNALSLGVHRLMA